MTKGMALEMGWAFSALVKRYRFPLWPSPPVLSQKVRDPEAA